MKKERIIITLPASVLAICLLVFLNGCAAPADNSLQNGSTASQQPAAGVTQEGDINQGKLPTIPPATGTQTTPSASADVIADGTYNEAGTYQSPAQTENVEFAFTIKDGVVTNVELVSKSTNKTSNMFQGLFITGLKADITGKKLSEIGTYDRLNGSSLTPKGYNMALAKLKEEA